MGAWRAVGYRVKSSQFAAIVAFAVLIAAGIYAEHQNNVVFMQKQRAEVAERLSVVRAKLEGGINANTQLVRGLVAVITSEPDMDQTRFAQLASELIDDNSQVRNIAAAPDLVVKLMHPVRGNEKAIGLDYRTMPAQRDAALRARDTGGLVLAGPVDLVQGGQGLIGRYPVFIRDDNGRRRFWGIVAAVLDLEALYTASGLTADLPIDIAIRGKDGLGEQGDLFYGNPEILSQQPETMSVVLPTGAWVISAIPNDGWATTPPNTWIIRAIFAAASILIVVPIVMSGRLVDERQRHIQEMRRREEEMERLSHRLELALDASKIGIWEIDAKTGELYWDDRMKELYGVRPEDDINDFERWLDCIHPDDLEQATAAFRRVLDGGERYESEFRSGQSVSYCRHIRAIGSAYIHSNGGRRIVGVNWDVSADLELNARLKLARDLAEARTSALEEAKAQMEHNANHDPLTGLPNRRYLDRILSEGGDGGRLPSALIHLDLDRFKQINDTLGHAAGDETLRHAAGILRANVREQDFVARIGGDEFVVVTMGPTSAACLAALAMSIIEAMRQPFTYQSQDCRAGVSAGIALAAPGDRNGRQLLVNADIALYEAKSRGRNRYEFFTEALQTAVIAGKKTADEILRGLERDEFVAWYQPQFDATSLAVVGAEVLVRWRHPERGILPPAAFLDTAEDINVMAAIDQRVLDQAMFQLLRWRAQDIAVPRISVNVSSARLHDENLIEGLKQLNFQPGDLAFELLESTFLDDGKEIVARNIAGLKDLGIDIEIDDFGTGYASIVSLVNLKPKRFKIDRQLIMPITKSETARNLVSSMIDIGQSLQIEVVAEGVETMEHVSILRRLGCSSLQGHVFARPMSGDDLSAYLVAYQREGNAEAIGAA
ncbi:EAL domain-containing protein [Rhizobium sp. EC-SD404]|uniref:bifunctional diguanylate cyclase/phosphodiesterase n=1 Tax=Rhizobium sp. EC-SD404 TaxID=2038389 RepID=UPI00125BE46F|nr:EAL domain-containing protein [Rhizobium sp. EC-SD404]VVT29671.1 PAS/PAC and Chase sensor-containing diguanylate cyclase/phosphodiesterase [Rhizobium sp. EC-SD404]